MSTSQLTAYAYLRIKNMLAGKIIEISLEVADQLTTPRKTPSQMQEKVLLQLLRKARKTAFGVHYRFDDLLKSGKGHLLRNFQTRIPIHDYKKLYDAWWHKTLTGQKDITWPGKVKYFALSSGTSDATSKRLPITPDMFDALRRNAFRLFSKLPAYNLPDNIYTKSWLAIGGTSRLDKIDGRYEGYLSGINARKIPVWTRAYYKPGTKIAAILDFEERTDSIAKLARQWDVGLIVGIPHWIQMTLEKVIRYHKIENLQEIWPNLACFVSGGVDPAPYRAYIERLAGKPLVFINTFLASEGFIAFQDQPDVEDMQLILNNGIFYEFIPYRTEYFDEHGDLIGSPPVYTIGHVREGVDYVMLLSTCSGAWRYLLGDIVRFTDVAKGRIHITGRTKYYINLCTEHLTGDNMTAAIAKTEEDLGIEIPEFMIAGVRDNNAFIHQWYVSATDHVTAHKLKETLDKNLAEVNDDYRCERMGVLEIKLEKVPVELFYEWQMQQKGKVAGIGQVKVPRVLNEKMHLQWKTFLESTKAK